MNTSLRTVLLLILLLTTAPAFAGGTNIYGPGMAGGTALSTASANSGMLLDHGLAALWANPAGALSHHHQIYAEGVVDGAFTGQSQISPADWRAGVGTIGYLYSLPERTVALAYMPRERTEGSADYGVGERINRTAWSEATLTYAQALPRGIDIGFTAGAIFGEARDGVLVSEADMDTVYKGTAWFGRFGLKHTSGLFRWGVTLESPAIGTMTLEQPVNVGFQRTDTELDYNGGFGLRVGAGWDLRFAAVEADIHYQMTSTAEAKRTADNAPTADDPITFTDLDKSANANDVISAGLAARLQLDPRILLNVGIRARFSDPEEVNFIQLGAGGTYIVNGELSLFGGVGVLFPSGDGTDGSTFSDLNPFVVKAGVLFHNPAE